MSSSSKRIIIIRWKCISRVRDLWSALHAARATRVPSSTRSTTNPTSTGTTSSARWSNCHPSLLSSFQQSFRKIKIRLPLNSRATNAGIDSSMQENLRVRQHPQAARRVERSQPQCYGGAQAQTCEGSSCLLKKCVEMSVLYKGACCFRGK